MRTDRAVSLHHCVSKIVLSLLILIMLPNIAYSQTVDLSAGFALAVPKGDYGDILDRNAYGVSIEGLIKPTDFPFSFGAEVNFLNYGSEERTEPLSSTIPDLRVRVENDNNFASGNLLMRIRPYEGRVSPYFDGLIGFKYIFTSTQIVDQSEIIASDTNFDDFAGTYGVGAGVSIRLFTFSKPVHDDKAGSLYFDFKARYMRGGEAEYLKEGSIIRDGTDVTYETYKSETDMLMYVFGLSFMF